MKQLPSTPALEAELPPQTSFLPTRPFFFNVVAQSLIQAPASAVFQTIIEFERYGDWNRFTSQADAELKEGAPIRLLVHGLMPWPLRRVEWIHSIVVDRRICWGMNVPFLLRANRSQYIAPLANGSTLYRTEDRLTGLLAPLVFFLFGKKMQKGFELVAEGLRDALEADAT